MNMNQPDPAGLFKQSQQQRPADNRSVMAQLQNRPAVAGTLPNVQIEPSSQPGNNWLVEMSQSGQLQQLLEAKAQQAQQAPNPFVELYQSGEMERMVKEAEARKAVDQLVEMSQNGTIKQLREFKEQQTLPGTQPHPNPFVELYQSGEMERAVQQSEQKQQINPLVELSNNGTLARMRLAHEDKQYQEDLARYEKQKREFIPYPGMGVNGYPEEPKPPARDFEQITKDWEKGVHQLRGTEFGQLLNQMETGLLTPEQEAQITLHIEPALDPQVRKQLQTARLTRDKVEILEQQAKAEEEQARAFEKDSLFMTPYQIAQDERFGQHTQSANVMGRNLGESITLNQAFKPDEDRLNSDDADIVADERAKRLFYQQQDAKYPVAALTGNILGAAPYIAGTGMALRGLRVANAMRGVKAGTASEQALGVIANKGAATTTGGRLAMGASEGALYDLASRPEGSEDMSLAENLQARATQVGFGVALGGLAELGLMKAGDLVKLAKDKRFEVQLKKESEAAGYGADTDSYLSDLLNIEQTEDGRLIARPKREAVSDLPPLEPEGAAAMDRLDTISLDTSDWPATPPEAEVTTQPATAEALQPTSPPIQPTTATTAEAPPITSSGTNTERVTTIQGTPIDIEYQLVDADSLTTSHLGNGVINPDYPPELQPRDRSRVASEAQLRNMASNLRPEWLGRSPKASDGAPIVGDDGLVESGNGRVSAIRYAYAMGNGDSYQQWLKENASQFGLDPASIEGMSKPVLVRKRTTPMDMEQRAAFAREANQSDIARLSASEQARMDANRLTDDDIMMFAPDESGNISSSANIPFLRRFVERVGGLEAGSMVDSQGRPTEEMQKRIQAAIFKKAYDDDRLLSLMAETTGADLRGEVSRNILGALNRAAPAFARARALGDIPPESDFIPNLMEAVDLVRQSRRDNQSLSELINQGSLLESVDSVTEELARFLDGNMRSTGRMGEVLKDLGQQLEQEASRGGADLFGSAPASKADFLKTTNRNMEARGEQPGSIFFREQSPTTRPEPAAQVLPEEASGGSTTGQSTGSGRAQAENARSDETLSREIEVTTPDGTEKIHVEKKPDGSITADDQPIPKGGDYVPNTHKNQTTEQANSAGTLYSNPVNFAIRQMAKSLNLGETITSGVGGGVYGATFSDEEIGSEQWWLDVLGGAGVASFGFGASRYLGIHGKDSFLDRFRQYLGQQYERIPGLGRGSPEMRQLKKQQQLMRQIINRQTGEMGEFLAKNFTPAERSQMADIIENRGYPKQANLIARQAQELDDFISYTADRMKELGMLPPDLETGAYLHRYYAKHLKLDSNLKEAFKQAKRQSLSGTYSMRRGTEETFKQEYLSPAVKQQLQEYDRINNSIKALKKTEGDLITDQTGIELAELREQLKELQAIELREYVGIQDGKPHSFLFMPDEVARVPGMEQPDPSDRVWSLRGTVGDMPVLWRDWTKAERESWGEITDAGYRFVRGQAEVAHDLSMATMFKKISDRSDWVSNEPRMINGEEWEQVPTTKIKNSQMFKYGALAGKYVKPDVWRSLEHYNQPLFGRGRAATIYRNLLDKWKLYKTVYNPVSHFNNSVSNLQMYYMAGYSARHLGSSINELRRGENSQYWREARDVGLFGTDWSSSLLEGGEQATNLKELAEILRNQPDVADAQQLNDSLSVINRFKTWLIESGNSVKNADTKLKSGAALAKAIGSPMIDAANKPIKAATDAAKWLYQKEDELFKLAVFIEERKKGVKPYDAMEAANRFFFDYNDLPDVVRKAKDFPIGSPFISYTYLALPAIIRNAVERPERMLALAAAFEGLNYASLQLDGQLEDNGYWDRVDAENALNPPWMKGRTMWGAPNTIDISGFKPGVDSYKLSLANAHAMGNPFAGESGKDLPMWPGFMSFWGPDPIGGNPVTRIPFDIIFNVDWKGDPIYSESDKFEQSLKYAYQAMFPSMPLFPGSWHQKKILEGMAGDMEADRQEDQPVNQLSESIVTAANAVSESLGGEQFTGVDWKGNQYKTSDALIASLGPKLRPYRAEDNYQYQINKIGKAMGDAQREFFRKVRGDYTEAQLEKFKQEYRKTMKDYQAQIDEIQEAYDVVH